MRKPIDIAVDTLLALVRKDPSGAKSLAHVLAVVPTAQSGRRLRLRLAQTLGAVVPPLVKTPRAMLLDEDDPTLAGRTDELLAFSEALSSHQITQLSTVGRGAGNEKITEEERLNLAKQLSDMRTILSPKAMSFADVASNLADDMPDEAERWRELAEIEKIYLGALERRGLKDRIFAMKEFKPSWPEIEEVLRFDDPAVFVPDGAVHPSLSQITPCATAADEAARIAEIFASVKPDEALPALCVADPEMFPEISAALKAKGIDVHDPSDTRLVTSSLGHLVAQLVSLRRTSSYSVFSAFIRGGDARRWICAGLKLSDEDMTAALVDLDNRQAEFLPEKIDDIAPKTKGTLRAIFEFVKVQLRKKSLRGILAAIFAGRTLDGGDPASREFASAAEVVNRLIDECGDNLDLFELRLDESTYSLEPDEGVDVLTDGWMELPFLDADELIVAGFREGCVPESTVGHPFLPDSLRHRLGLPDNAYKEARDRAILSIAVGMREQGAFRVFFHSIDSKGDVLKPSRLLFETDDDSDLVARVRAMYGNKAGTAEGSAADLPKAWKLRLPTPPQVRELERISPTRLDGYLRCPFTYYLRDVNILGDKRMDDRAEELESWEYGNLAHEALEAFGTSDLRDSTDVGAMRVFLEERVDAQLAERFGSAVPAIVSLQGESVKRRLANFAAIQAKRRTEGWRIAAVERKLELQYGHTRFHGKCDRIDINEASGEWCVIDYKTWDSPKNAQSFETKRDGTRVWKSFQLPLYCAMLDADSEEAFASAKLDRISSCYCVLGKTADDVVFTAPFGGAYVPEAETIVRKLIGRIEQGIFWPPAATQEWQYDYADWLYPTPEASVDEDWIADQNERLAKAGSFVASAK